MVDIKTLLKTTPETLAAQQRDALLKEVQSTFSRLINHLTKGEFDIANHMLFDSPAGDGHGCDNRCISFDHIIEPVGDTPTDIGDIVQRLEQLTTTIERLKKK